MNETITIAELKSLVKSGKLKKLHWSYTKEYVSRKTDGYVREYAGRFGKGYALLEPRWQSTQYSYITYYVFDDAAAE